MKFKPSPEADRRAAKLSAKLQEKDRYEKYLMERIEKAQKRNNTLRAIISNLFQGQPAN